MRYDLRRGGVFAKARAARGGGQAHPVGRAHGVLAVLLYRRHTSPWNFRDCAGNFGSLGAGDDCPASWHGGRVQSGGRMKSAFPILVLLLSLAAATPAFARSGMPHPIDTKPAAAEPAKAQAP